MEILLVIAACVGIYYWVKISKRKKAEREKQRRDNLIQKYGDEAVVEKIIGKQVWQGMNLEQLKDSWGEPLDIDDKVLKTKTKSVWKYGFISKGRYRQKVLIEDGVVVGWENQ